MKYALFGFICTAYIHTNTSYIRIGNNKRKKGKKKY